MIQQAAGEKARCAASVESLSPLRRARVVIGVDGSESSWHAFHWGCGEAFRLGGRAIAVFVSSPSTYRTSMMVGALGLDCCDYGYLDQAQRSTAADIYREIVTRVRVASCDLLFLHRWGDPVEQLTHIACQTRADVLVVGRSRKLLCSFPFSVGWRLARQEAESVVVIVP